MAALHIFYPGALMLTFGQHRFEVYIDDGLVKASSGYRKAWEVAVAPKPGNHKLEIRAFNRLTAGRRSWFFSFAVPQDGAHRLLLRISRAWGTWREPLLEAVAPSNTHKAPDVKREKNDHQVTPDE